MKIKILIILISFCTSVFAQNREVIWERFNSVSPGLLQLGVINTEKTVNAKNSIWSIGCETLDRDYADFHSYKNYLDDLGIKRARIQSGWAKSEPQKGKYNFEWLDVIVNDLVSKKIEPWMVLCYGNPIYGANEKLGGKIFTDKETMDGWLKYVRQVVKRYKNDVKEWEIWNEPNLGDNINFADSYAQLLIKTVKVIKEEQPDAIILGFSLSGNLSLTFTKNVYEILKANGQTDIVDYLTFHPYLVNPDETRYNIEALYNLARSYNPKIKMYQGENGCPSTLEWGHALNQYPWTEISQAKWLLRRMANDWSMGIRSSIFTIVDLQYFNMHQSFGLLRTNLEKKVVYKRPSYYAVRNMVNLFDDSMVRDKRLDYKSTSHKHITIESIKKDNKEVGAIMWFDEQIPSDQLSWDNIELQIHGLEIKDPVLVDIITGRVYDINKQSYRNVGGDLKLRNFPVWDSPMLLIARDNLSWKKSSSEMQATNKDKEVLGIL